METTNCRFCEHIETQEETDTYRCENCGAFQEIREEQRL